eukprot:COSAG06_NODE_886_length_11771_cov_13.431203_7_plen_76_part_00
MKPQSKGCVCFSCRMHAQGSFNADVIAVSVGLEWVGWCSAIEIVIGSSIACVPRPALRVTSPQQHFNLITGVFWK